MSTLASDEIHLNSYRLVTVRKSWSSYVHVTQYPIVSTRSATASSLKWPIKPRLHQGNMLPGNMLLVAGNMLPVSRQHGIPLYPATDGQQTGNNFVDNNMLLVATCWRQQCKRGFMSSGTLSSVLFCVYIDGLLCMLRESNVGCFIGDVSVSYTHLTLPTIYSV